MVVTVNLSSEVAQRLAERALCMGVTLETYLEQLAESNISEINGGPPDSGKVSDEEFDRLLDELCAGPRIPVLADDFSRSDIYSDHD
jgi:hypothetical protein